MKSQRAKAQQPAQKVVRRDPLKKKEKKTEYRQSKGRRTEVPFAMSRNGRLAPPKIEGSPYSGDGRIKVKHREYVQDIAGSVAFSALNLSINPGLAQVFPWLSILAAQYESYLFRKLKFCYETEKSASTSGFIGLAIDFDAADSVPLNKQTLMSYHNAVRSAVWNECVYDADTKDLKKFGIQRYIRSGNLAANQDVKTYDVGDLIVGVQGEADTSLIGELYVEYEVELMTPQVSADASLPNSFSQAFTGSTRALPFATAGAITGGLAIVPSGSTLTFNKVGKYVVILGYAGTVLTDNNATLTGTATSSNHIQSFQGHNTAVDKGYQNFLVTVSDIGQTVILDMTACAATVSSCSVRVAPYSAG